MGVKYNSNSYGHSTEILSVRSSHGFSAPKMIFLYWVEMSLMVTVENLKEKIEAYNVIWKTPSKDHNGSMPLGNGEMGLNLWVEQSGDLVLLISRTDSWDENERLCKIGRLRFKFLPEMKKKSAFLRKFGRNSPFQQELRIYLGDICIKYQTEDNVYEIRIWVDADRDVAHFEFKSDNPTPVSVELDLWRTHKREFRKGENNYVNGFRNGTYIYPDTVIERPDGLCWYHDNPVSTWETSLKLQHLEPILGDPEHHPDPLLHRIFGGLVKCGALIKKSSRIMSSETPQTSYEVSVYSQTIPRSTETNWLTEIESLVQEDSLISSAEKGQTTQKWWEKFWNKSFVLIMGSKTAFNLTQAYLLQRFIQAAGGRGNYPIKFNGSIFTVNTKFDPDYRRWGGHYWFQNTRLPYWPMLAGGDWEMMHPFFDMYLKSVALAQVRNKIYFNHEGFFFPETMSFWGTYDNMNYGWERKNDPPANFVNNQYIRYHYNSSLEFLLMLINYFEYTRDINFLQEKILPFAGDCLKFWRHHWPVGEDGKIEMFPSQSLETYWDARNPTPDIAGLVYCLQKLLSLADEFPEKIGMDLRGDWKDLNNLIPDIPFMTRNGVKIIAPAYLDLPKRTNIENPALYAVFPFRLFGLMKPKLDLAINTFKQRIQKRHNGWTQDGIQAAYLGLIKDAQTNLIKRCRLKNKQSRFPVFWGPNYDWIPDQDHGSNLLMNLYAMLLQSDEDKIYLFPAWPKNWDVEFTLWAPNKTQIYGKLKKGELQEISMKPKTHPFAIKNMLK